MDLLSDVVTERLLLRPVTAEHVSAVVAGRRLPGWAPDFPTEGDLVIARMLDRDGLPSDPTFGQRLVLERCTGLVVGGIGLFGPPEDGRVEFGYGIVESRRGRGYATEAARALVRVALGLAGVTEVVAGVDPANVASVRVLEKAGLSFRSHDGAEAQYSITRAPGWAAPAALGRSALPQRGLTAGETAVDQW